MTKPSLDGPAEPALKAADRVFRFASGAPARLLAVRMLLVEDERRLTDVLASGLATEGFAVDVAHDGRDGLWLATENPYDVIVLDVMLPRLNGYAVCAKLRAAENWTPILVLTAKDGVHDEAEALDTGADDYLSKPFSYVVLLARLRALVRRGGTARPVSISVGDLTLDPAGLRCRRGEVDIALTPKEFAVLHGLARRPGEIVSKRELLAQAWDFAFDGDPNIVEVYVRYLRRKVDVPFGLATIETVRSLGYRLVPDGR